MKWFAVWHKVVRKAEFRALPAPIRAAWLDCLCFASENELRGFLPSVKQMAFELHEDEATLADYIRILEEGEWIDYVEGYDQRHIHNWEKWQAVAKKQTEAHRQKTYRARKKAGQIHLADGNQDEEDDGEQIELDGIGPTPEKTATAWREDAFEEFWAESWRRGGKADAEKAYAKAVKTEDFAAKIIAAMRKQKPYYLGKEADWRPHMSTWLNKQLWDKEPDIPQVGGTDNQTPTNPNAYKPYVADWKDKDAA